MDSSRLAINSVSTGAERLDAALAAYADAGFENVEFHLGAVHEYLDDGHGIGDVSDLLARHDLTCIGGFETSVACFGDGPDVVTDNERVVRNAELLDALDAEVLIVGTDGPHDGGTDADVLDECARTFADLAEHLSHTDVTLGIEFNWSPVVRSLRSAATVSRRSGVDNVGVVFDPAHYHCTPTKFAELTPSNVDEIVHVHVDDVVDKPGDLSHCNDDRALPGEGHLDLDALFDRIDAGGYGGYYSVELFDERFREMPVERAADRLYRSLASLASP